MAEFVGCVEDKEEGWMHLDWMAVRALLGVDLSSASKTYRKEWYVAVAKSLAGREGRVDKLLKKKVGGEAAKKGKGARKVAKARGRKRKAAEEDPTPMDDTVCYHMH